MPMIVDLDAPLIEPPETVTSPDGWFTAVVDEPWAGVVLSYNADTPSAARNLALNPSTEIDLSNTLLYSFGTRARITSDAWVGAACIQHTQTAGSGLCGTRYTIEAAPEGTVLTASVRVKLDGTGTTALFVFRSSSATLGSVNVGTPTPGQWVEVTAQFTVPAGQTCTEVAIAYNAPVGAVWLSDAMMVEADVAAPSDYIDGDQPNCVWDGAPHASTSQLVTAAPNVADIRKVRIVRQDPGAAAPLPVRSADTAWAIEGVGTAYDHEAPLGVAVVYTATPIYADGTEGAPSSLAVTLPAPVRGPQDVWIKSVDEPGLSARVTVRSWPDLTWSARIEQASVEGSRFPVASQDVYAAASSDIVIDAEGSQIEVLEQLLATPGVRLIQTRPDYHRPDQFVLFGDVQQVMDSTPTESRSYQASVIQVARPDTAGQPMRLPAWSWDAVGVQFATWDAFSASFASWASASVNGAL